MNDDVRNYHAAREAFVSAYEQEALRYQQAKRTGDNDTAQAALITMGGQKASIDALDRIAAEHQASVAYGPAPSKYGLSEEEREVAHNSFGPMKVNGNYVDLSKEEKERLYAEQKVKLHRMRATGQYHITSEQNG